ncbi:MAG: cytochrome c biogenesis protein CcsA [Methylococcales bacterium]|jgi:ABC-type uncharacterized transport system permease subunit|nr:cytochrome c biogenesis protein CcsA [Methylococcales bacterium]
MNPIILGSLSITCYLLSFFSIILQLLKKEWFLNFSKYKVFALIAFGFLLHNLILSQALLTEQGLNLNLLNALSLLSSTAILVFLITYLQHPIENLGIFILPFTSVAIFLAVTFPGQHIVSTSWQLTTHILASMLAYSLLTLAAAQAILLSIQNRLLKNKHPGGIIRQFPPLKDMEIILIKLIKIGFLLLTASLVTGFIFLDNMFTQHVVHKTIISILAWLIFSVFLFGHMKFGWRGKIAVRWTISGFTALMIAYLGSKLVLELLLQR